MFYRFILNAVLGLAFVLSASLSVAQGASMAMPMDKMAGMAMGDHHDCGGCSGDTGKNGMKSPACAQVCLAPLAAVLPAEFSIAEVEMPVQFVAGDPLEWDWSPAPNPSPPRA